MKIVILTGAGISAESGLGTFRDVDGLWTKYDLKDVATPQGFARDPGLVQGFYNARRENCAAAEPNAALFALARLQKQTGAVIVTQNVDDLHERAGATAVHMHGSLNQALCAACDHRWPAPAKMTPTDPCPKCHAPATRPDVVWFGELPYAMDQIEQELLRADLFVSIGTSGTVYPAAGFVQIAQQAGADTLELNLEPSDTASAFDCAIYGAATEVVPRWVDTILSE